MNVHEKVCRLNFLLSCLLYFNKYIDNEHIKGEREVRRKLTFHIGKYIEFGWQNQSPIDVNHHNKFKIIIG